MEKIGQWLQVGANIGILAGLVLVALQLQQNLHLTRGALYSTYMQGWAASDRSVQSENFSKALAKAITEPENLADSEMLEVEGYLRSSLDQWSNLLALHDLGIFRLSPEKVIGDEIEMVFGNRFAVTWWEESRDEWAPALRTIVDKSIANSQGIQGYDQRKLNRVRTKLQARP